MAFENFFTTLSQTASNSSFSGIFGTTAQILSVSANLGSLSSEGAGIIQWVRYRLGEPRLPSYLTNLQIFSAFEESLIEYGAIINQFQASNWLSNLLGLSRDITKEDITNKLPHEYFDYLMRAVAPVGTESGVGGLQNNRKAYFTITPSSQDINLYHFIDNQSGSSLSAYLASVSSTRFYVRHVWHSEPTSIYRYYDPYSSTNVMSQEFKYESFNNESTFYVYPIWTDVLRAGMLEANDKVRRSNHSYNIVGNNIRLLPSPNRDLKVWIEYTPEFDPYHADFQNPLFSDDSVSGISSITNVPFRDIKYDEINSAGRRWVRQYTLAVSMEIEGRIRRHFSSIPIPNGEIQMDGEALVSEGIEKQKELKEELRADLEKTTTTKLMQDDADTAEQLNRQLSFIPSPAQMMILG